jgi:trimethylamine--corrinoid protein Co-methyltransferase
MIQNKLRILSSNQIDSLHQKTLQVFEEVGLEVLDKKACRMWDDWGAKWDLTTNRVYIPKSLVEKGLKSVPDQIICGARDENQSFVIGDGSVLGRNGGGPGQLTDSITGELRDASRDDCANYARLVDALENINIAAPLYEQESQPETRDLGTLFRMFTNTSKHINIRLLNPKSLPYFIEMAEIVAGGKEQLAKSPIITMLESPIAPLKHPDVLTDTILSCAEAGIPLEICSMPIAGATGPVTLAGSLLMSNVEMLGAVIFGQLARPGAPMIFTPRIMVMDLASGYALTGSVENALLVTAGAQMAKELYRIPVNMHGPYTDSPVPDCQAGIENTYFSLMPAFAGADILTGAGHLQGGLIVNFTQLVIDNDIMGMVNRALEGLAVDDEMMGFGAIKDSIVDDNLLMHPHTIRHMRENRNRPKLVTRESRTNWIEKGSRSMEKRASEKVAEILKNHQPIPLDRHIQNELEKLISHAEKDFMGEA